MWWMIFFAFWSWMLFSSIQTLAHPAILLQLYRFLPFTTKLILEHSWESTIRMILLQRLETLRSLTPLDLPNARAYSQTRLSPSWRFFSTVIHSSSRLLLVFHEYLPIVPASKQFLDNAMLKTIETLYLHHMVIGIIPSDFGLPNLWYIIVLEFVIVLVEVVSELLHH